MLGGPATPVPRPASMKGPKSVATRFRERLAFVLDG
jgi:hypothetical protein